MNISVDSWRKVRHPSAEGSGVAGAIGKWEKYCKIPGSLDEAGMVKAKAAAEALGNALKTSKGKLAEDNGLKTKLTATQKALETANQKNDTKKAEKLEKERDTLNKKIKADEERVEATEDLIDLWSKGTAKYLRSLESAHAKLLSHDQALDEQLEHFNIANQLLEKAQTLIREHDSRMDGLDLKTLIQKIKLGNSDPETFEEAVGKVFTAMDDQDTELKRFLSTINELIHGAVEHYSDPNTLMKDPRTDTDSKARLRQGAEEVLLKLRDAKLSHRKATKALAGLPKMNKFMEQYRDRFYQHHHGVDKAPPR